MKYLNLEKKIFTVNRLLTLKPDLGCNILLTVRYYDLVNALFDLICSKLVDY
jgi:hypothetical protein